MTQAEIIKRLEAIAQTSLHDLKDEAVLGLLTERKKLLEEEALIEEEQKKRDQEALLKKQEQERKEKENRDQELQLKKQTLTSRLLEVNKSINPDQDDEKLLALIQERKLLEAELKVLSIDARGEHEPTLPPEPFEPKEEIVPVQVMPQTRVEEKIDTEIAPPFKDEEAPVESAEEETPIKDSKANESSEKITINTATDYSGTSHVSARGKVSEIEESEGRIALDSTLQTAEYQGYLSELKANINSLGTFLQNLPITVKRNRAFMLEVATVDPAYAMHYADKDTLKKDESFNVSIAGMNNQRNTGNPLSEMLPEMRTGAVLLAGVKNDFRNIRFIQPAMPEYETILALAQKGALEEVAALKNAQDIKFLLPAVLQRDKAFMKEVEKIINAG